MHHGQPKSSVHAFGDEEGLDAIGNKRLAFRRKEAVASILHHGKALEVVVRVRRDDRGGDSDSSHDEKCQRFSEIWKTGG